MFSDRGNFAGQFDLAGTAGYVRQSGVDLTYSGTAMVSDGMRIDGFLLTEVLAFVPESDDIYALMGGALFHHPAVLA